MYAIVETGGKQVKVESGKVINVEKLPVEAGETVVFDRVLFLKSEDGVKIGRPYLDDIRVQGKVLKHFKDKKVIIMKHKRRKNYKRKKGHRQWLSAVQIESIGAQIQEGQEIQEQEEGNE
ncbi:MAG: 50S ribosomal protein L21 [Deltaproteobacteria bacterium]|nr:50S ribosomal protein L21 [Deltaproteobacteria bacterium]MBW2067964.1 50S ribosomal protein L21 [Deltaproteobacteria bacterium]